MKIITSFILSAFVLLAVFGLYLPTAEHMGHEGCPFAAGASAFCVTPLAHIEHWQSSLGVILAELFTLAVALFFAIQVRPVLCDNLHHERYRRQRRTPMRPTVLIELFSRGILNRKESYAFFVAL